VAYSTDSSSLIQADAVGIGKCSLLPGNRVVSSRSCHAELIPPLRLASGVSKTIQDRCDLIVAVAPGHPADDLQGFQWGSTIGRWTWPLYFDLSVHSAFAVDQFGRSSS
jgi:hypothetical protein